MLGRECPTWPESDHHRGPCQFPGPGRPSCRGRAMWGGRAARALSTSQWAGQFSAPPLRLMGTAARGLSGPHAGPRPRNAGLRRIFRRPGASGGFSAVLRPLEDFPPSLGLRRIFHRPGASGGRIKVAFTCVDPARGLLSAARPLSWTPRGPLGPRVQLYFTPQGSSGVR